MCACVLRVCCVCVHAVVGVLKGLLAVLLGFVLLGGVGPAGVTPMNLAGIAMNCGGGVW